MQHTISVRKHRGNPVARPEIYQRARLLHTVRFNADAEMSQEIGPADGNRGGSCVNPDHSSNDQVFGYRSFTRIDRQHVSVPGLGGQSKQQDDR